MSRRRWLWLILAVYLLLGAGYAWVVPLGEAPDEIDHYLYVRYLVEKRAFPVMNPVPAENETMEANQPPLFYLLNAMVTAPFPMTASAEFPQNACFTFDSHDGGRAHFYLHEAAENNFFASAYLAFRIARLLSVLLGAVVIWLAFQLGRQMMPGDERLGLLAAGILAFNPQFIFMMASVNNDVLTAVLGAALVYFSIEAVRQPSLFRFAGLGVLVGLGLLTKFALLAFWPLPLLAAVWVGLNGRWRQLLANLLIILGLPVVIAGWWYVRAVRLYGDPLAWEVHLQAKGSEVLRTTALTLADYREFVVIHFQSYWAWFGWLKIQAPGWVYGVLAAGVILAILGMGLVLRDILRQLRSIRPQQFDNIVTEFPVATAVLFNCLATAAIYASLIRYIQTINWSGYQGRLAYAAAAPIAALLGFGWYRLTSVFAGRWPRSATRLISTVPIFALGLWATVTLFQLGAAFPRPALFMPPTDWARVCQTVPDAFYVEAVDFPPSVLPAEVFEVSVGGYRLSEDMVSGEVALLNWNGALLDTAVLQFSEPGQRPVTQSVQLAVPVGSLPAAGRLVLFVGEQTIELGQIKIASNETVTVQPDTPFPVNFADQIMLLGYDLHVESTQVRLVTYWQALQALPESYTLFVHLLGADGRLLAQQDALPLGGRYPTSIWDVGELVIDEAIFPLAPEGGADRLVVGWYELATLERLVVKETAVGLEDQIMIPLDLD